MRVFTCCNMRIPLTCESAQRSYKQSSLLTFILLAFNMGGNVEGRREKSRWMTFFGRREVCITKPLQTTIELGLTHAIIIAANSVVVVVALTLNIMAK